MDEAAEQQEQNNPAGLLLFCRALRTLPCWDSPGDCMMQFVAEQKQIAQSLVAENDAVTAAVDAVGEVTAAEFAEAAVAPVAASEPLPLALIGVAEVGPADGSDAAENGAVEVVVAVDTTAAVFVALALVQVQVQPRSPNQDYCNPAVAAAEDTHCSGRPAAWPVSSMDCPSAHSSWQPEQVILAPDSVEEHSPGYKGTD